MPNALGPLVLALIFSLKSREKEVEFYYVASRIAQEEVRKGKQNEDTDSLFLADTKRKETKIENDEEANTTKSSHNNFKRRDMSEVTCFYCNKKGHFTNKCFKNILDSKKKNEEANQVEEDYLFYAFTNDYAKSSRERYLDSGATMHMSPKREWFKTYKTLSSPRAVKMGDHSKQNGIAIGQIQVKFPNGTTGILKDAMHVPGIKRNLLSVNKMDDAGFFVAFGQNTCKILDKNLKEIAKGNRDGNLYCLKDSTTVESVTLNSEVTNENFKSNILWHHRLGHVNVQTLKNMKCKKIVDGLNKCTFEKKNLCPACMKGKQTRTPLAILLLTLLRCLS